MKWQFLHNPPVENSCSDFHLLEHSPLIHPKAKSDKILLGLQKVVWGLSSITFNETIKRYQRDVTGC